HRVKTTRTSRKLSEWTPLSEILDEAGVLPFLGKRNTWQRMIRVRIKRAFSRLLHVLVLLVPPDPDPLAGHHHCQRWVSIRHLPVAHDTAGRTAGDFGTAQGAVEQSGGPGLDGQF